jgi:hypothetical protein
MGGHVRGIVTQYRPPRRLAYSWNVFGPDESDSPYPESYLAFEIEPATPLIRLKLTHLPVLERFERQNMMGWHTFLDMLETALSGRTVAPRAVYMQANAARYGIDPGNLQR